VLQKSDRVEDKISRDRQMVERILAEVRRNGHAVFDNPSMSEMSIAVPLFVKGNVIGGVVVRFIRSAITADQAIDKHIVLMKKTAEEIGKAFDQAHTPEP